MKPKSIIAHGKKLAASFWVAVLSLCILAGLSASAQPAFRSQFTQVRATVPVNSTNLTVLGGPTNTVILVNGAASANFSVSGLPAGAAAVLLDGYGNPLTSTTQSTNLEINLFTTNVAEGVYNFTLNIGGLDTNSLPVTNQFPFVLQVAHIWLGNGIGGFGVSNNWSTATNWLGGVPAATDDVVIGDYGAQTNSATYGIGSTPDIGIDSSMAVASLRFAQDTYTNLVTTNALYHSIRIAPGATLSVVGTNALTGLNLLRDTIAEFGFSPDSTPGLNIYGTNGTLQVTNLNANFSVLLGNSENPVLNLSNLGTFNCDVSRVAVSDFRGYPNYAALNLGYNAGRDSNSYTGIPRQLWSTVYLARSNYITATYVDPNNYTNEFTRTYALTMQNNEQQGNGSSVNTYFFLGRTNVFNLDSINFIGSSSASGNGGGTKFNAFNEKNATNPGVLFRNADGVSRMSIFSCSDDGGTNEGRSNVKSTTDFSYGNFTASGTGVGSGYVNLLVDRLYVARDRTLIASNSTPNVQGDLIFGGGVVNANSVWLGCQEHSNKVDWTTLFGAAPYLNYCQGRMVVTNSPYSASTFTVNGNLTLGYTADRNPAASAQQYNTYGSVTIYSNVTFSVSNVICDGGLNYYDNNGRLNTITINQGGNFIVSNTIGFPNPGANDFSAADPRGMYLDALTMTAGKLSLFVNPASVNVYVRSLSTPGIVPSIIKVAGLTGVSSYPVQIPVISYLNPTAPFMNADVSALGTNYHGYVLNNTPNSSVDVYITTNAPNNLIWTGAVNNNWDTSTLNWVTTNGVQTNFNLGDVVTFNDSSSVTNINIVNSVVPNQTGVGVTISNSVNQYTFSGGTIAGTALVSKQGTNLVEFDAVEQGPINITAGTFTGSGQIGTTIVYTNVVLNYTGNINGGLTSTGLVTFAGTETGPVSIQGGTLDNSGTMSTTSGQVVSVAVGVSITNEASGTIVVGTLPVNSSLDFDIPLGSVLANFGTINIWQPKMSVEGLMYGTGTVSYPNGGGLDSIANTSDPRLVINTYGVISPAPSPFNSLGIMDVYARFDYNNDPSAGQDGVAGVATVRINVDFGNPQQNSYFNCDRWNNDTGYLLMTNINPGAGSFALGQNFQIFQNSSGAPFNFIDTLGFCPTVVPYVPGPGLQWGTTNFNLYGSLSVIQTPMVWIGGDGNWNTNGTEANWLAGGVFGDNQGAVFDDRGTVTTINLNGRVSPAGVITNVVNGVFTTNEPAVYPGIVVSNAINNYVIAGTGHIGGMTGLYKTGPGTLTLLTSNDFTGNVIVDNGTLVISNYNAVANIVSLGIQGGGESENDVILDGGTLNYVGLLNVNLSNGKDTYPILNPNGGTIGVASSTNMLIVNKFVAGPGTLTKVGAGTLQLTSTTDDYMGGTLINAGQLMLTTSAAGYGPVTLNNSGALQLTNNFTLTNIINVAGATTSIQLLGNSTNILSGAWTGGGTVTLSSANMCVFSGGMTNFTGTLSLGASTGLFQFNSSTNSNPCTGSAAAAFNLGTGSATLDNLNGGGLTYNLGSLAGGAGTVLTGRITNSAAVPGTTYSIGANGNSTTFSGKITNGLDTVSVVKVGAGALWLNGASTYTGSTMVSSGVLGGTGSIASPLTVTAGGTLVPGASLTSIGTFTVNNSVTLGGTTLLKINVTNSPTTNDLLAVTGTLTGGGALVVTNLGPNIVNGSTFKLFSQAVSGFSSVTLPSGGGSYVWNNNLAANGTITLVSGGGSSVNTNPTNIVVSVTNGVLTLAWPADHTGWRLQVQTNPLANGLGTNWFTVPNSTNVDMENIPEDVKQGSIFYRMVYP